MGELRDRQARIAEVDRRRRRRILLFVFGLPAASVCLSLFVVIVLPVLTRPSAANRAACEAVADAVAYSRLFGEVPEEHRTRFLEWSGWTEEDVARLDRTLLREQEARAAWVGLTPDQALVIPPDSESSEEGRVYRRWIMLRFRIMFMLREWDADGVRALLEEESAKKSVRLRKRAVCLEFVQ